MSSLSSIVLHQLSAQLTRQADRGVVSNQVRKQPQQPGQASAHCTTATCDTCWSRHAPRSGLVSPGTPQTCSKLMALVGYG